MLYEFALMPDVMDAAVTHPGQGFDILLEELLRGLCANGLVASLCGNQLAAVLEQRCGALPPAHQARVMAYIKRLHDLNRFTRHPAGSIKKPQTDAEWLQAASEARLQSGLNKIVYYSTPIPPSNEPACLHYPSLLRSRYWLERKRTFNVRQDSDSYSLVLAPLLRWDKIVHLIDPYFSTRSDYMATLRHCGDVLGNRPHGLGGGAIFIHVNNPESFWDSAYCTVPDFVGRWQAELKRLMKTDWRHEVHLCIWGHTGGTHRMHDRYILTNQCGVQVPAGLDCRSGPEVKSTEWCLLDADDWQRRLEEYAPNFDEGQRGKVFKLLRHIVFPRGYGNGASAGR